MEILTRRGKKVEIEDAIVSHSENNWSHFDVVQTKSTTTEGRSSSAKEMMRNSSCRSSQASKEFGATVIGRRIDSCCEGNLK